MKGRGGGKYAAVTVLLIGLTAFLSVLLLSPRFGGQHSKFPVSGFMVLASFLVGALPKQAHAFVGSGPLFVARLSIPPSASRLAAATATTLASARPLALGRYRVGAAPARTDSAASAAKSLTGSWALFASGGAGAVGAAGRSAAAEVTTEGGAAVEAMTKHVLVPVADGSEEIESVTIIDTLVRAGAVVTVASVADGVEVKCSRGVIIKADCRLAECEQRDWDAVVCPGGMPGATHLKESEALEAILKKQASEGRIVAAICAAPAVVLASHGLLEGRKATCYPANAFTAQIPQLVDEKVVVDGNLITSQGPATSMAFALQLVDSLFGSAKAEEVGKGMLFP